MPACNGRSASENPPTVRFWADSFRPVFEGLKQVADGLIQASVGLIQANQAMKTVVDAALAVRDEHEDLRDTFARLESLVIAQGQDLRAMRDRLDSGDG
jgi:hypothetical protein